MICLFCSLGLIDLNQKWEWKAEDKGSIFRLCIIQNITQGLFILWIFSRKYFLGFPMFGFMENRSRWRIYSWSMKMWMVWGRQLFSKWVKVISCTFDNSPTWTKIFLLCATHLRNQQPFVAHQNGWSVPPGYQPVIVCCHCLSPLCLPSTEGTVFRLCYFVKFLALAQVQTQYLEVRDPAENNLLDYCWTDHWIISHIVDIIHNLNIFKFHIGINYKLLFIF